MPPTDRYPPLELTPQQRKSRTLQALLAQLVGLAARRPVLIVLEDAHWLDPTTLELFGLVVEPHAGISSAARVITFRPEFRPALDGPRACAALA